MIDMYFAMKIFVLKSVLYAEMLVNVFVIRSMDCAYEAEHGFDAAFREDRMCRSRSMYCDPILQTGFYHLYHKLVEDELRVLGDYPTRISLHGERRFVCSIPFMFPECQEDESCKRDLDLALPYWFEMWTTGKRPGCPPGLENYICSKKTTNVMAFDVGGP